MQLWNKDKRKLGKAIGMLGHFSCFHFTHFLSVCVCTDGWVQVLLRAVVGQKAKGGMFMKDCRRLWTQQSPLLSRWPNAYRIRETMLPFSHPHQETQPWHIPYQGQRCPAENHPQKQLFARRRYVSCGLRSQGYTRVEGHKHNYLWAYVKYQQCGGCLKQPGGIFEREMKSYKNKKT